VDAALWARRFVLAHPALAKLIRLAKIREPIRAIAIGRHQEEQT
jgi:hypothetical protein